MLFLAIKNVFRRKNQVLISIIVTLISTMVFTVIYNIYHETKEGIELNQSRMGADIVIYPANAENNPQDFLFSGVSEMKYIEEDLVLERIPKEFIEKMTSQFFVKTLAGASCCGTDATYRIVGINPMTDFLIKPWLKEENLEDLTKDEVLFGQNIGVEFGQRAFLLNHIFDVKGRLYRTGSGMDDSVFMDIEKARELGEKTFEPKDFGNKDPEKLITTIFIKLKEGISVDSFIDELELDDLNAKIVHISEIRDMMKQQVNSYLSVFLIFALTIFFVSAIAISTLYNMMAKDRKSEIGYLRSIGLSRKEIIKEGFLEVLIQSGIAGVLGAILGALSTIFITKKIQMLMSLPIGYDFKNIIVSILLSITFAIGISFLATIRPILKNAMIEPSQAITGGIE